MFVMWFVTLMDHVENTTSHWLKPDCCPQQFQQNHEFVFGFLIVWAHESLAAVDVIDCYPDQVSTVPELLEMMVGL